MSKTHLQQSQVSGSLSYSDSVQRSDLFKANRTLADDLNSLRTQVKGILGEETWMSAQAISLNNLKAQLTGTLSANNVAAAGTLSVSGVSSVGVLTSSAGIKIENGGLSIAGDRLEVQGTIAATGVADFGSLYTDGLAGISGSLTVAGAAALKSGLTVTGAMSGSGNLLVGGAATVAGILDVNNTISASALKVDGDVAQRLYIVDADGSLKDEANMIFDGSALKVTGAISGSGALSAGGALTVAGAAALNSTLTVAGAASINGILDVNNTMSASAIKIDGDVAQRLYIVDADGSIKDEANMTFDGSALKVTGAVSGSGALSAGGALTVAGASALNGALDVAGVSHFNNNMYVSGTFYVTGAMDVSGSALFRNGLEIAGDSLEITGSFGVSGSTSFDGSVKIVGDVAQRLYIVDADGSIKDESKLSFNGSTMFVTGAVDISGNANIGGSMTIAGVTVNTAVADFNAGVTANEIKIDGDVAQRLYIVGASGELKDEANMTFDGSALKVTGAVSGSGALQAGGALTVAGAASLNSTLAVAGAASINGILDVNNTVSASALKIDGDVAQRLYIVDADGSLKDEANLVFNGSKLTVTGSFESTGNAVVNQLTASNGLKVSAGGLNVAGDRLYVDGTFGVTGVSDFASIYASGAANISGSMVVAGILDVNNAISASALKIDGDVAQRLYIVDSDGSLKDESKLTFNGTTLAVNGSASFTGNVQVDGDLRVKGAMTYIDTTNMRVQDAFIYLATGSVGTTDSGIVLHGGAGASMDLVIGQDGGAGEVIFGKGNRGPDGDGAMNGIDLVPAWMSEIKLGSKEGLFSGSLALAGSDLKVKSAEGALKLVAFGDEEFSVAAADEMASFQTQFGSSKTLVGAILSAAGAGGASSFRKGKLMGSAVTAQFGGSLTFSSVGSLRSTGDAAAGMDVYLNGVLLSQSDDYTVSSVSQIDFVAGFRVEAEDIITVVLRNAAL